jgi:hypothetical protein
MLRSMPIGRSTPRSTPRRRTAVGTPGCLLSGCLVMALLAPPAAAEPTPPAVQTAAPPPAAAPADGSPAPPPPPPSPAPAAASPAPTTRMPSRNASPTEVEVLIGGGQLLAGAAASLGTLFLVGVVSSAGGGAGLLLGVAAPAVTGGVVCWIGGQSAGYDQGCGMPILGAYLGALTIIPAAFLGASLTDSGEMDMSAFLGGAAGIGLAWLFMQPLVSTVFWHVWKEPRFPAAFPPAPAGATPSPASAAGAALPPLARRPPLPAFTRSQRLAGEMIIPLRWTF